MKQKLINIAMVFFIETKSTKYVTFFLYKMINYQLILTFRSSESINPSRKLRLDHFVIDFQLIDTVGNPNHAFWNHQIAIFDGKKSRLGFCSGHNREEIKQTGEIRFTFLMEIYQIFPMVVKTLPGDVSSWLQSCPRDFIQKKSNMPVSIKKTIAIYI